ncbi:hypothetical protein ACFQ9U_29235 [Streptomyces sp. NPDC056568]|uniref:hypothetical protein n=1 Tax=Streptomyces sp. NPDC056568 TaxID=3345866 RepID=UPI00368E083A
MAVAVALQTTVLVIVIALLSAAGAGKLARMDGATYSSALTRAAAAFATVITLAATVIAALAAVSLRHRRGQGARTPPRRPTSLS